MSAAPHFTPATFKFLRDLARNNRKEWFAEHKPRYERDVRGPCLAFIRDLATPLSRISPQMVASDKPVGGSLFRIHRDTRFSKDKSPYKQHAGLTFFHAATKSAARGSAANAAFGRLDAPVFYLHLQPGESFIGGGVWHPQPDSLKRIRAYLLNNPTSWTRATRSPAFLKHYALGGDTLSRPPQGFDPAHPLIEDLKRKDFIASRALKDSDVCADDFAQRVVADFRALSPLMDWLCGALDLEY